MFPNSLYSLPILAALHSPFLAFSGDKLSHTLHNHKRPVPSGGKPKESVCLFG